MELETPRLRLRPYTGDDLELLVPLLGDPEGMRTMGGPFDRKGAQAWLDRNLQRYAETDGLGRYAVFLRETGEYVGDCGPVPTTVEGTPEVELGWIVDPRFRGRGIATEAAAGWRDRCFGPLGLTRLISMVDEHNIASRRVAEKIGMQVERTALWADGLPYLMYATG